MSLFRWFTKRLQSVEALQPRPVLDLDRRIAAIAALRNEPAMQEPARHFVRQCDPVVIPELLRRFDVMIEPPPSFAAREPSVCAWITCWQTALYEILYRFGEHALPALREMARAGANAVAIVLLCRLAAEGIERRRIVADLIDQMPYLPIAQRLDVADRLRWLAHKDPAMAAIVEDLRQAPAFEEARIEAEQWTDQ